MRYLLISIFAISACTSGNPGRGGRTNTTTGSTGGTTTAGTTGGTNSGCQGLACYKVSCPGGGSTTISGKVTAPNGRDPVPEALVYVPTTVPEFPPHVDCEVCNEPFGGAPVASVTTAVDGSFRLLDVPATTNVPIVIQKGRFRRTINLDISACTDTPLTVEQSRLPKNQQEGDLPKMAVAIGDFDQIECVLRSFGIDDREFTGPGGSGAVHLYDNGSLSAGFGGTTEFYDLLTSAQRLQQYNLVFVNCTAFGWDAFDNPSLVATNLYEYVNKGGRLYATDWAYDYLEQVKEFSPYIYFSGGGSMTAAQPVSAGRTGADTKPFIATVADPLLVQWLQAAGATTGDQIQVQDLLPDWVLVDSTAMDPYPSQTWIKGTTNGKERPLSITYDFNMCGRVLFSSYHTREPGGGDPFEGGPFPTYCKSSPTNMIAQEKVLEFLILHISSCVGPVG